MHENLITIATFHNEPEFLLARARLESADIECFAQDENMLRIAAWHSHVFGGIKLRLGNLMRKTRLPSCGKRCRSKVNKVAA